MKDKIQQLNKLNVKNVRYNAVRNLIYIFAFLVFISACKTTGEIKDGSTAFALKKYELAQQLLPGEISSTSNEDVKLTKIVELAESYAFANKPGKAVDWYQKAVDLSNRDQYYFELAKAQKRNEQYEDAIENFKIYQERTRDIFYSSPELRMCEEALGYDSELSNLIVTQLDEVNTTKIDYATTLFEGDMVGITSMRAEATGDINHPWYGQKNSDLFQAKVTEDGLSGAELIEGPFNTDWPEGNITFNKAHTMAYFTRCDFLEEGPSYCYLMESRFLGSEWSEPELISLFGDTVNIIQPCLSADEQRLFFVSDAPFGYGGSDIYFLQKINDEWSEPFNAGFAINTEGNEMFPTLDSKGNLYFSSDGRTGFGGLDIFKALPQKQQFSKAQHLPYPINSGGDDFALLWIQEATGEEVDGVLEKAIFSSDRKGGKGYDDIYLYEKIFLNYFELEVLVQEKNYKDPEDSESEVLGMVPLANADVTLTNIQTGVAVEATTDDKGKVEFDLEDNSDYKIFVAKTGYFNKSVNTTTKGVADKDEIIVKLYEEVELEKIFPEKEIVIENIYYDYDKATLRAESLPILDQLVSFFEENSDLTIEIGSHTDSRGSDEYNEALSQRRAQSVVDYLIGRGVTTETLKAKGYGESKLTNECANGIECSEEAHQANRRTTFRVISSDGVLDSEE